MFRSFPTLERINITENLANGTRALLRFKVSADAADSINLHKFTVQIATTTANVSNVNIFAFTDSGFSTPVSGIRSDGGLAQTDVASPLGSTDIEIFAQNGSGASTTLEVPAGTTRYFEVRGNVSGSATGAAVTTQLQGDAAYGALSSLMTDVTMLNNDTNNDFIWSPNSTTTSSVSTNDWTNGFGIVGLPASNLTPQTLSP